MALPERELHQLQRERSMREPQPGQSPFLRPKFCDQRWMGSGKVPKHQGDSGRVFDGENVETGASPETMAQLRGISEGMTALSSTAHIVSPWYIELGYRTQSKRLVYMPKFRRFRADAAPDTDALLLQSDVLFAISVIEPSTPNKPRFVLRRLEDIIGLLSFVFQQNGNEFILDETAATLWRSLRKSLPRPSRVGQVSGTALETVRRLLAWLFRLAQTMDTSAQGTNPVMANFCSVVLGEFLSICHDGENG